MLTLGLGEYFISWSGTWEAVGTGFAVGQTGAQIPALYLLAVVREQVPPKLPVLWVPLQTGSGLDSSCSLKKKLPQTQQLKRFIYCISLVSWHW